MSRNNFCRIFTAINNTLDTGRTASILILLTLLSCPASQARAGQDSLSGSPGANPSRPVAPTVQSKQPVLEEDEVVQMFDRARKLGDLQRDGSPAFSLDVKIYLPTDQGIIEASFREIWKSKENWSQEFTLPRFKQVTVRTGDREARLQNSNHIPVEAIEFLAGFRTVPPDLALSKSKSTLTHEGREGRVIDCASLKFRGDPDSSRVHEYCFDSSSGVMVRQSFREWGRVWEYSDFGEWNKLQYPREMKVFADGGLVEEARVVALEPLNDKDASSLVAPRGAEEWTVCENPKPAVLASSDPSILLSLPRNPRSRTVLWIEVAPDGGVEDINFLNTRLSPEKAQALFANIKKTWKFEPSKCGQTPQPANFIFELGPP